MARKNELNRLLVREKELEMQQEALKRYRAFLMTQDSEDENDENQLEEEERCEENAELEQERVYLAEASQERKNKMSSKNHRYR